jgi:hypothetical protein
MSEETLSILGRHRRYESRGTFGIFAAEGKILAAEKEIPWFKGSSVHAADW